MDCWILSYQGTFLQNLKRYGLGEIEPLFDRAETLFNMANDAEELCYVRLRRVQQLFGRFQKTTEALNILEEAEKSAFTLKHQKYICEVLLEHGSMFSRLGHYREAEPYFLDVLAMNPQDPRQFAGCLLKIGTNYYRKQQFQETLIYFERVLEFDRDTEFELHYATTLIVYGSSLMGLDRMTEAAQSSLQALTYFSELKNIGMMATLHERLASCYHALSS